MKKFTLFAFLVLFTSVFIPSCQKDGFLQEKPEITDQTASKFITFKDFDQVGDRTNEPDPEPSECCWVQYYNYNQTGQTIFVQFVYKKPRYDSRYEVYLNHVESGQSILIDKSTFHETIKNCEYHSAFIRLNGAANYYFPGVSGHFSLTYNILSYISNSTLSIWGTCASATSPGIFVRAVE